MAEEIEKLVLKPGSVTPYLSNFQQSADYESFFFTDLILSNRRVETLAKTMDEVKEVRKCDLSINNIIDISSLKDMQHLQYLNLAKNKIKALTLFTQEEMFPNLKWLDVSNNKITELPGFKLPKLEYLDIGYNKLEKANDAWNGHPTIRVLKSVDNKFKSIAVFKAMPLLEELYLANNQITALTGWEQLPALRKLHLRRNKIEKYDEEAPPLENLEWINLRANKVANMEFLERLFKLEKLRDINVLNNPVEQNASSFNMLVAEVLMKKPTITRFCKSVITEANQLEAVYFKQFKWTKSEEERKKKAAEDAAREAKEAAEANQ